MIKLEAYYNKDGTFEAEGTGDELLLEGTAAVLAILAHIKADMGMKYVDMVIKIVTNEIRKGYADDQM